MADVSHVSKDKVRSNAAGARVVPGRQPSLVRRVFLSLAVVSTVASLVVMVLATSIYQSTALGDTGRMLDAEAALIQSMLDGNEHDADKLAGMSLGDMRVTLMEPDGTVVYDNQGNVDDMPNHETRPEIAEALETGSGSAERESATVGRVSIYRALRLDDGSVVRVSVDRDGALAAISHDLLAVALIVAVVVLACWVVARYVTNRIMRPVLSIDSANPDPNSSYRELCPLLQRISDQMDVLKDADLMRREFTSNVTHELKTPLSSISAASELIRDGIARPSDVPEFAGRIYDEARHMTDLVNDILILSKLDESERSRDRDLVGKSEPVDLNQRLLEVCARLAPVADSANVTLECSGDPVIVRGNPRLLDELAYNLCDNAIRYNRKGGSVTGWVGLVDGAPVLRVSDTGVGIPADMQRKVFERFFRVDSSRARQTGGTGLGLAIVKHAAAYHGAKIRLESQVGVGTTITVLFPKGSLVNL